MESRSMRVPSSAIRGHRSKGREAGPGEKLGGSLLVDQLGAEGGAQEAEDLVVVVLALRPRELATTAVDQREAQLCRQQAAGEVGVGDLADHDLDSLGGGCHELLRR